MDAWQFGQRANSLMVAAGALTMKLQFGQLNWTVSVMRAVRMNVGEMGVVASISAIGSGWQSNDHGTGSLVTEDLSSAVTKRVTCHSDRPCSTGKMSFSRHPATILERRCQDADSN